jgi:hypothetical protein
LGQQESAARNTCAAQSPLSPGPDSEWSLGGGGIAWRDKNSERHSLCGQHSHFAVAKLELQADVRGAAAPAAGQRLLQAEPEAVAGSRGPSGRAESALRWFTTAVLYAGFLGMVRAGAAQAEPGLPS